MDWEAPSHADADPDSGDVKPGQRKAAERKAGEPNGSGEPVPAGADPSGEGVPGSVAGTETSSELTESDMTSFELADSDTATFDVADTDPGGSDPGGSDPGGSDRSGHWDWRSAIRAGSATAVVSPERQKPRPRPPWPPAGRLDSARPPRPPRRRRKERGPTMAGGAIVSRPLINPRLRADPRLRIWSSRTAVTIVVYLIATVWLSARISLTIAAVYLAADILLRRRTMEIIPAGVRVTAAQRSTQRRLRLLRPAGYLALHACTIPGTDSIVDHLVVGPAGIFALDSEKLDRRLPVHAIDRIMYHGPASLEKRLDHARWEAKQAATLIGAELGHRVQVQPAMVIYGPRVPWIVMRLNGVDVFSGGRVGTYFRRKSKEAARGHLRTTEIAMILGAAARAMPPLR